MNWYRGSRVRGSSKFTGPADSATCDSHAPAPPASTSVLSNAKNADRAAAANRHASGPDIAQHSTKINGRSCATDQRTPPARDTRTIRSGNANSPVRDRGTSFRRDQGTRRQQRPQIRDDVRLHVDLLRPDHPDHDQRPASIDFSNV